MTAAAFLCGKTAKARPINKKQNRAILTQTLDRKRPEHSCFGLLRLENFDVVAGEYVAALLLRAICFRRAADFSREHVDEAARGAVADFVRDFCHGFSAVRQQALCFFQTRVDDVLGGGVAGLLLEQMR